MARAAEVSQAVPAAAASPKPVFLITIDTEGDNLWARPREITTRNADYIPRFQSLCESYGFKTTYLVNYEMAVDPRFQEIGRDVLARGTGEIGMHLHAWNSPPLVPLTDDDLRHQPYLAEYPPAVVREKVKFMTDLLAETFGTAVVSHRAGRWNLSPTYARTLAENGYLADCSVTPHVSWRRNLGAPTGNGGPDYTLFPEGPYFLDLDEPSRAGHSSLLEVPLTILSGRRPLCRVLPPRVRSHGFVQRVLDRMLPADWLMAQRRNGEAMSSVVPRALAQGRPCVMMALHSSELMPAGSPSFRDEAEVEALYERFATVFQSARDRTRGATLAEYRATFAQPAPPA